jgi:hypothetical protein
MRFSRLRGAAALCSATFAAALGGCASGSLPLQSGIGQAPAPAVLGASAPRLVFVGSSVAGTIDTFELANGKYRSIGQILDANGPEGLHTDGAANLYVADQGLGSEGPGEGDIAVYPKGATQPSRYIVPGYNVADVVPAPRGHLYAANFGPDGQFGPGSVSVFGRTSDVPLRTMKIPHSFQGAGIVRDRASGDVFVSYSASGSDGRIVRFAKGRPPAIDLGVSYGPPWGIAEDASGNLLVADGNGPIRIYSQAGHSLGTISVPGTAYRLAFSHDGSRLFVTTFYNFDVEIFSYPAGKMLGTIHAPEWSKNAWPDGIAVWPPLP